MPPVPEAFDDELGGSGQLDFLVEVKGLALCLELWLEALPESGDIDRGGGHQVKQGDSGIRCFTQHQ
jgi:hypothetical protein